MLRSNGKDRDEKSCNFLQEFGSRAVVFFWPWFDLRNVAQPCIMFNSVRVLGSGVSGDIGAHHTSPQCALENIKLAPRVLRRGVILLVLEVSFVYSKCEDSLNTLC